MRVCLVLDSVEVTDWSHQNATCGEENSGFAKEMTPNQLTVSRTIQPPSLHLSDHCPEISFPLDLKEHRYRELPTVHKSAHPPIKAQGDH
jgi:hypothetical protein